MARKLRVEYNKNRCIGNGSCAAIAPGYFELHGRKAELINSKPVGRETHSIDAETDEIDASAIIDAATACPVNAIKVFDIGKKEDIVGFNINETNARKVIATYDDAKDFVIDGKKYFLIKVDRKNKNIEVGFCNEKNKVALKVIGKSPIEIYSTLINKEKIQVRKDHAAYLGKELEKAHMALRHDVEYVQDKELDLNKKVSR